MHAIPFNYRKSYLSVAESRRWSVDHPVGDPYGGPAYGEKKMPVAGVVLMVAGAIEGIGTLVGGLMFVSGALSVAGSLTGNKTLSMLGAVAGLAAGGISAFNAWDASNVANMTGEQLAERTSDGFTQALVKGDVAGMESAIPGSAPFGYDQMALQTQNALVDAGMQGGNGMINTIGGSPLAGTDTVGQSFNSILGVDGQPISGVAPTGVADASQVAGAGQSAAPQAAQLPAGSQAPGVGEDIGKVVENLGKAPETPGSSAPSVGSSSTSAPAGTDADFSYLDPAKRAANQDLPGAPGAGDPVTGAAGSNKGMIGEVMDKAGKVGDWMQKNDKLVNMAGKVFERLDPSDIEKAQAEYMKAKANNDDAAAEYYRAKIAEMQRQAANANARGGNALGSGNAISANGSAYTTGQTRNINQLSAGK